jgi:hypothetical protein
MPRFALGATAAAVVGAVLLIPGAGAAATNKCHHSGDKVISVDQLVIYFSGSSYYGCYTKTGKVTHLVSHKGYFPYSVFAHGSHATVTDAGPLTIQGPADTQFVTFWNLKTGKKYETHEYGGGVDLGFVDSPYGDPITAIVYLDGHTRVLDVIYDKGFKRLSTKSVKNKSVTIGPGRVVRWTEGSKKRSARL